MIKNLPVILVSGFFVVGLALVGWKIFAPSLPEGAVKVPQLSSVGAEGKVAYDANCAECHGQNAAGTDKGPSFINNIYIPGHHGDAAFFRAAKQGVPQHHWPFGDMPVPPNVSDEEIAVIVRYVREVQAANGITGPSR